MRICHIRVYHPRKPPSNNFGPILNENNIKLQKKRFSPDHHGHQEPRRPSALVQQPRKPQSSKIEFIFMNIFRVTNFSFSNAFFLLISRTLHLYRCVIRRDFFPLKSRISYSVKSTNRINFDEAKKSSRIIYSSVLE